MATADINPTACPATKERPIPFSGAMVRAILAGRKTQTRRLITHPHAAEVQVWAPIGDARWDMGVYVEGSAASMGYIRCPYGVAGDRLWVREAWRVHRDYDALDAAGVLDATDGGAAWKGVIHYEADGPHPESAGRYRHGRFMPRWASRIDLEVTEVRVQRLQEISEEDAIAEGCEPGDWITDADIEAVEPGPARDLARALGPGRLTAKAAYADLWDSINGERAPWSANPWVWAITFRRVR